MKIIAANKAYQKTIDRVYESDQQQVFHFWNELDESRRKNLLDQLAGFDFHWLDRLKREFILSPLTSQASIKLRPADFIPLPKTKTQQDEFLQAKGIGEEALKNGKVAVFLVAGGQATRLGFPGPKGKFPINPARNQTLFHLHAEKILTLCKRYQSAIPWYIMTSETNHAETVAFFEEQKYFGLEKEEVIFLKQEMIPAFDAGGHLILDAKDHVFCNPDGHGGALAALKKNHALDDMKKKGIDYIFYFQVDNVLVNICDPVFLGFHISGNAEISTKILKINPGEKIGTIGLLNGKLTVVEYTEIEKYGYSGARMMGNISQYVMSVEFLRRLHGGRDSLPWHMNRKAVPCLDEDGERVQPDKPNAVKFEKFIFDILPMASRYVLLEADRSLEYSPVKNATGHCSPASARRDMLRVYGEG